MSLQVLSLTFGPWEIFQLLVLTLRSIERNSAAGQGYLNSVGGGGGDGFDQIETGPVPSGSSSVGLAPGGGGGGRGKGQTVIEKQVGS